MRNHLTPKQVTNKNGIVTTVYTRLMKSLGSTPKITPLPSPQPPAAPNSVPIDPEREALIQKTSQLAASEISPSSTSDRILNAMKDVCSKLPQKTLDNLHEYISEELHGVPNNNRRRFLRDIYSERNTDLSIPVNEYLEYRRTVDDHAVAEEYPFFMFISKSLYNYSQLPELDDYSAADDDTKKKVSAVILAASMLYGAARTRIDEARGVRNMSEKEIIALPLDIDSGLRINDRGIVDLIVEQPDKVDDICHLIIEDQVTSPELIRDKIESSSQALRDGIL